MGLPHEDISRLQQQNSSFEQTMRADLQRLKDELAEHNRSLSELRTELKKVRTEHTNFILELSRLNADRADEIKSLQARVTKLEGKVIF